MRHTCVRVWGCVCTCACVLGYQREAASSSRCHCGSIYLPIKTTIQTRHIKVQEALLSLNKLTVGGMTLVIETRCSAQDQNPMKALLSQQRPLCQQPPGRNERRPEVWLSWRVGKTTWQPSARSRQQRSGPPQSLPVLRALEPTLRGRKPGQQGRGRGCRVLRPLPSCRACAAGCESEVTGKGRRNSVGTALCVGGRRCRPHSLLGWGQRHQ